MPARSRLQATAARGLPASSGREAELRAARPGARAGRRGHGQVVALVGEAGVGKSRLVWEFTRLAPHPRLAGARDRSVSYGKATPYLPVIDLLKAYFRIEARDDPRRDAREGRGQAADARPRAGAPPPATAGAARRTRRRPRVGCARPAPAPQRTLDAVKTPAAPGEPGPATAAGLRGSPLDRLGDPGAARQPRREPADRPPPAPGQLPARVRSTPGAARPTTSSSGSTRCRPRAPRHCSMPARRGPAARAAQARC